VLPGDLDLTAILIFLFQGYGSTESATPPHPCA